MALIYATILLFDKCNNCTTHGKNFIKFTSGGNLHVKYEVEIHNFRYQSLLSRTFEKVSTIRDPLLNYFLPAFPRS